MRTAVGITMWASPRRSGSAFGLGQALAQPDAALIGRLFAVRDVALAQTLRHPDPQVQRQALKVGVAIDAVDALGSLLAAARGGRPTGLLGVGAGALLFVGLGLAALGDAEAAP